MKKLILPILIAVVITGCGQPQTFGGISECKSDNTKKIHERITDYPVPANERASFKGQKIAESVSKGKVQREQYEIEIVDIKQIDRGVEVLARAWENGEQIGFGKDGSIDIERFIIINPPILVDDPNGDIVREWTDRITGEKHTRTLKEDTQEALLQSLEHTIKVKQQKFGDGKIVSGKVGNTTTTVYPAAGTGGGTADTDFNHSYGSGSGVSWTTIHDRTTCELVGETGATGNVFYYHADTGTNNWRRLGRYGATLDTSSIPDDDDIDSATFSIVGNSKSDGLSISPTVNVVSFSPATDDDFVGGDYDNFGTTKWASDVAYADLTTDSSTYTDFTFTAGNLSNINKTGNTKVGLREAAYDISDTEPSWSSDTYSNWNAVYADQTGTASDPKLVVEHSEAAAEEPKKVQSEFWF